MHNKFASNHFMRRTHQLTVAAALLTLAGCRKPTYVFPESPLPPNTILLSQMMRELSAQPGFNEALIHQLDGSGKKGPALLTPELLDELRKRLLGNDWQGLDRFPGWTMPEINRTVHLVSHEASKSEKLEASSAVHPGTSPATAQANQYLDLGPYALDKAETVSLEQPSTLPTFSSEAIVTDLGHGVTRGDGPNALTSEHAESQRLADMLNRLAVNKLEGAQVFQVRNPVESMIDKGIQLPPRAGSPVVYKLIAAYGDPEDLLAALQYIGHTVTVIDSRYFANFAHLHFNGEDVMAPFFIDTKLAVPNSGSRPLLVPVSHAELEWHIRGPLMNADVSYYFGIDGKAEWRVMDTLDQAWVLKRDAHIYTGADAVEVTRLAGLMTAAYMRLHAANPTLPFGGYYALGVCQDGVSAIEKKMTGKVTLFPNTADLSLFNDTRDEEINSLIASVPKDRDDDKPDPARVFGSLPTTNFNEVTIPGLAADLNATYAAWKAGTLEHTHTGWEKARAYAIVASAVVLAMFAAVFTLKLFERGPVQRNPHR